MPPSTNTPAVAISDTESAASDPDSIRTGTKSALVKAARSVGFTATDSQVEQLVRHAELVDAANATANLTGLQGVSEIVAKLTIPSIKLLAPAGGWLPTSEWWDGRRVIDIGTGGGFPGIPMAVMLPECELTLLDARAKKCVFLHTAIAELGLANVTVVNSRAETAGRDPRHRERYDVATARAVARLPELAELVLGFVSVGGVAVAPKGGSARDLNDEFQRANKALSVMGSAPPVVLPPASGVADTPDAERLVYLMKIASTPATYPRNAGVPRKRPLS